MNMTSAHHASRSIRREFLLSTAVLFGGGLLVAVGVLAATRPLFESPFQAAIFVGLLVAADLVVLFFFLRTLLRRSVFEPLERIGGHAERIASGGYDHRIPPEEGQEFDRLVRSLNTMAERLISEQEMLAENIRSLDMTNRELVSTSEELVRAARMASVGTLAAGLAHEVGNPLGALMGYLDIARRRIERGGDVDAPLESAVEEARRLDRIVRSVLDFARPSEDGGGGLDEGGRRPVISFARAVDRALALLKGRGALEGVTIRFIHEPGPYPVRALSQHLEQVLLNLVMNAALAVKGVDDPEVEIRMASEVVTTPELKRRRASDPPGVDYSHRRRIPLLHGERGPRETDREVVLQVLDNGPGVPPDRMSSIFDPFFTTREPGEGSGVGLAITARIVEELGGRVEVANREDGGALFTVRLPQAAAEAVQDEDEEAPLPSGDAVSGSEPR